MSGSNRGKFIVAAIALLLSAIVGFYLWQEANSHETRYQIEAKEQTDYQAEAAKEQAKIACKRITPIEPCIEQNIQSDRPSERNEQDLVAQQMMAAWTKAMGKAAIIGMAIGIVGVFLIWQTWAETRKAAASASKTYQSFIDVERAKLTPFISDIEQVKISDNKWVKCVTIDVANIGKGTAFFQYIHWAWASSIPAYEDIDIFGPERNEIILAGENHIVGYIKSLRPMSEPEYLIALISYRSALSGDHKTWLVYKVYSGMADDERPEDWPQDT